MLQLLQLLEVGRCFLLEARDGQHLGAELSIPPEDARNVVPSFPRLHLVFQPPHSPFLNACEYALAAVRAKAARASLPDPGAFVSWMNAELSSPEELVPRIKCAGWVARCTTGLVRDSCRDRQDIASDALGDLSVVSAPIYDSGIAAARIVDAWRRESLAARRIRRREHAVQREARHLQQGGWAIVRSELDLPHFHA